MFNKGLICAMGAALSFSIMNMLVKKLSFTMGSGEIVFGRSFIGIVILLVIMKSLNVGFSRKDIPSLVFRGAVGGLSMFLIFVAISGMHLGDVSILQQLSAIFVLLLSALYLKEKISVKTYPALIVIGAGAVCLLRPWEYDSFSVYAILAILSALLAAMAYLTISKLFKSGGHNSWEIVFYFLFFSMLIGMFGMLKNSHYPNNNEMILLLAIGLVSLLAQALMTRAYGSANAVMVSFVMYLGVFFNAMWGYLFFDEIMHVLSIIGGILIIGGSMYLTITKNRQHSKHIAKKG